MKTFKIEIPNGYEIDQEKSTFEKIVSDRVRGRNTSELLIGNSWAFRLLKPHKIKIRISFFIVSCFYR